MIKNEQFKYFILLLILHLAFQFKNSAQPFINIESGIASPLYNDTRIPGNSGTFFSLKDDLKTSPVFFYRLRCGYLFNKHHISILYAPIAFTSEGKFRDDVLFMNENFIANNLTTGYYKFNSYRLTYWYKIVETERINIGLGLTGKIRDAEIKLNSNSVEASKTDLGFVPLIHFFFSYSIQNKILFKLEGDALGAKQGRAEDFLLSFNYQLTHAVQLFSGYRILEGGSNGSSVYTFAWINYFSFGTNIILKKKVQ